MVLNHCYYYLINIIIFVIISDDFCCLSHFYYHCFILLFFIIDYLLWRTLLISFMWEDQTTMQWDKTLDNLSCYEGQLCRGVSLGLRAGRRREEHDNKAINSITLPADYHSTEQQRQEKKFLHSKCENERFCRSFFKLLLECIRTSSAPSRPHSFIFIYSHKDLKQCNIHNIMYNNNFTVQFLVMLLFKRMITFGVVVSCFCLAFINCVIFTLARFYTVHVAVAMLETV